MADQKVSDLPSLNGADVDAADLLYIIDASAGSAGSKKITVGQYQLAPVSGGTANGVVYLNASKVATAGSDLVFDGSNLGLGATPSAAIASTTIEIGVNKSGAFGALGGGPVDNAFVSANAYPTGSADPAFTSWKYTRTGTAAKYEAGLGGAHAWFTAPSGTAGNAISFTQAMTLDASGNLLVGYTATPSGGTKTTNIISTQGLSVNNNGGVYNNGVFQVNGDGNTSNTAGTFYQGTASAIAHIQFQNSNGIVGSITTAGSATLYNATSDYRLKTVIGPVANAGQRIDALEPIEYEWKSDGSRTRGFLAHKFQEVYAGSVTGSKDAVDAEGNPVYQAMQASSSEVIADLVAEIQSLRQRLAAAGI